MNQLMILYSIIDYSTYLLFKSATGQRTFYRIVTLWNSLDSDLKLCKTVAGFSVN